MQRLDTLDAQFELVANSYPQHTAIVEEGKRISYADLQQRSSHLAKWILAQERLQACLPIAIYLPNSIDFVCSKLAILKANHAYLPLDPKYPSQRIISILRMAEVKLIITTTIMQDTLPEGDWEVCCIDQMNRFARPTPDISLKPNRAADIAYIIFTSGSTGTPKGATIRHENVMNVVHWTHDCFAMKPLEVGAQLTRVVFDASVWEYWANLLIGNTLVIIPEQVMLDQDELRRQVLKHQIGYMFLPTPLGELFIREELLPGSVLKWAWVGGDRLLQRPIPEFNAKVANIYGPTECTIVSVYDTVEPILSDTPPPIGYPVANCQIHILDEDLKPVPDGEKGEICILGAGVGSGYYNAPQITDLAYIPNPFNDDPKDIMYRSGDLGRLNAQGKYECLGRIDFQVKIRGYRIELGEIEAVINLHDQIKDVIVLAEGDGTDKELIAFYTTRHGNSIADTELMALCQAKLADYMIPEKYQHHRDFPLTANGKIDRKALARSLMNATEVSPAAAPETEFEQSVADIWKQALSLSQVFLDDRFYYLGGHSIKAVQVVGLVRKKLSIDAKIGALLANPTLREFCAYLTNVKHEANIGIEAVPERDSYPLSWGQESMWYYWQLDPNRLDYIVIIRFDLDFVPELELLQQAVLYLQNRHAIMRSGIRNIDGIPQLFFRKEQPLDLEYHLLERDINEPEGSDRSYSFGYPEHSDVYPYPFVSNELVQLEERIRHCAFDPERDPLYRLYLLNFANEQAILLMNIHHIITDGWSIGIWQKELRSVYFALEAAQEPKLINLPISYGDYSLWEQISQPQKRYTKQLEFWKSILDPLPEVVDFPHRLAAADNVPKGKRIWWKLGTEISQSLVAKSQSEGNSLFATLMGLFKILLHLYSGSNDLTLLSVFAGRGELETRNLLGLLTNLFFVRSQVNPLQSLSAQISSENEACSAAMQNLDYPFEQLLKEIFPRHDRHSEAIAKIVFILQNYPFEHSQEREFIRSMRDIGSHSPKFDLLFTVEEDSNDLLCWMEYRPSLYEDAMMQRIAEQFCLLCKLYIGHGETPVKDLDILLPREKERLLQSFAGPVRPLSDKTYIDLWYERLPRVSQRIAVIADGIEYPYQDLESRSNRILRLLDKEISQRGFVGICMQRGFWLSASLLAILKHGSAFMPLDLKYPDERLQHMISDAQTQIVLTDVQGKQRLVEMGFGNDLKVICLDEIASVVLSWEDSPLPVRTKAQDPAYLIYTSGSTGKPKGVMISHENLLNHNLYAIEAFGLHEYDRVLQFGSLSFDLSIEEIFPTWLCGAALIFRSEGILDNEQGFWDFTTSQAISVIDIPTAFWHYLTDALMQRELPSSLRLCIIGGEKANSEQLKKWQRLTKGKLGLINTYGPTECTIIATAHVATAQDHAFPIGRPIANTHIYLLDSNMRHVPLGAEGELCIGGKGVGLGYLNQLEATAASFVPDPHDPQAMLYRSGDLARYSEEGILFFTGRRDSQIKLMGYRIELNEIAAAIRASQGIENALVLHNTDDPQRPFLCAYLIVNDSFVSESDLRMNLKQHLPEYMIPAFFVLMDAFPRSPNGKINTKALPQPELKSPATSAGDGKFYTPEQEVLCKAIEETLDTQSISIKDNFFNLGGNSLLSMKLIQRLRHAGLQLNIEQLFKSSDIEELASTLKIYREEGKTFGEMCLIQLKKGDPNKKPLVLIHSLPGDILGYVHLVAKLPFDLPVYGIQALGLIDPDHAHNDICQMAEYYLDILLKSGFQDFYLGGWCFGGRVAVEMALLYRNKNRYMPKVFLFEAFAYNPIPALKPAYLIHRAKTVLKNLHLIPHLVKVIIKSRSGYQTNFTREEVFQDTGIFKNRGLVRMKNVKAMYRCQMKKYPGELILFKAKKQHPDMMYDHTMGWDIFTTRLRIHVVNGTHENILKPPQADFIAKTIMEYLD